ncbi:nucleotide exchange factor GrpE [Haloechinothrix halophila]|uniref:nucleotide exchange factor GrpE n=1 Tax=Haloechinothrix halophila TaxID=1069073 RepID=UPI0004207015|nr:nucleotide exchange factor GrpE [Haloechinothrix halophila]
MSGNYDEGEAVRPEEPVIVRDRRKIDPETGELREEPIVEDAPRPADGSGPPAGGEIVDDAVAPASDVEKELAERTADLQRVQAEYANYRKRVERDKVANTTAAKASLANQLLPLLDDIERAEQHGDLTGAFKAVADKLVTTLQQAGLESFGTENEPFDPSVHEAVQHNTSSDVKEPTVTTVLRRGYKFGERVLRPAMVAVTDHEPGQEERPEVLVDPAEPAEPPAREENN